MTIPEAVEQDILTRHGDTRINPTDIVTVFSRGSVDDRTINTFIESAG